MGTIFPSVRPQFGRVQATNVIPELPDSAVPIVTLNSPKRIIFILNSLNKDVILTWAGLDAFFLPALTSLTIPLGTNSFQAASGIVIGVYNMGSIPTVGSIGVTAL